ncbi:hypothetical protein BDV25DRAFT_130329 [Aspergillus avenaceus]|uniref:Zn(2)-C6 fungal-type domain-containing protein n=1 Tax=Aspergillus avenaceus TaxID=36643 RepID=A0A5N6TTU5_ASPAV|nr:hypothetical protein BDV25DRAFT_130329 [Aspergillus avenaceus]
MTHSETPQRRQNTSCDACRRSKRRCRLPSTETGEPGLVCTNCRRLGHACTFEFAQSQAASRRGRRQRPTRNSLRTECDDSTVPDIPANIPTNQQQANISDQDLAHWLNLDINSFGDSCDFLSDDAFLSGPDEPACADTGLETHDQSSLTPWKPELLHGVMPYSSQFMIGSSPRSPIQLLNSRLEATVLDECLARIYETIVTGCASRYVSYDRNLAATSSRYELEDEQKRKPTEVASVTDARLLESSSTQSASNGHHRGPDTLLKPSEAGLEDTSYKMTVLGAFRFLDHFSDLFGNRLSFAARRQADNVMKATTLATGDAVNKIKTHGASSDSLMNAFYDSWFRTQSLIKESQPILSFRIVYAMLMFDGIAVPEKAGGQPSDAHEFLESALRKLCDLSELVDQYRGNLGPFSVYGALIEASLRAALTSHHTMPFANLSQDYTESSYNDVFGVWSNQCSLSNHDLDEIVPNVCRQAVAESFRIWVQIIDVKGSLNELMKDNFKLHHRTYASIAATVEAISKYNRAFRPFTISCMERLDHLSVKSKLSAVSLAMFWDLGVLVLVESLKPIVGRHHHLLDPTLPSTIRAYQGDSVISLSRTAESLLSLRPEELFNIQNGMVAEAQITSYHITPILVATTFQKAIGNVIDMRFSSGSRYSFGIEATDDKGWMHQIDIMMKGLSTLDATIGGAQVANMAIKKLMREHGDILSECWSCDYET